MDTLANCVFGISTNIQNNENTELDNFFEYTNQLLEQGRTYHPVILFNCKILNAFCIF